MDSSNYQKTFCSECYKKMSKEQKKQYSFIEGSKLDVEGKKGGFILGGIFGAIIGRSGTKYGENWAVKHSQKKYGYTQKEMDNFSIDVFDMHAGLLKDSKHRAVMDKFESKTNSRYYKKYIQDKVR
jgi:hypothetical protein